MFGGWGMAQNKDKDEIDPQIPPQINTLVILYVNHFFSLCNISTKMWENKVSYQRRVMSDIM